MRQSIVLVSLAALALIPLAVPSRFEGALGLVARAAARGARRTVG